MCPFDAVFGLIKQRNHLEHSDTVDHLANVVEFVTNVAILYGIGIEGVRGPHTQEGPCHYQKLKLTLRHQIRKPCICGRLQ